MMSALDLGTDVLTRSPVRVPLFDTTRYPTSHVLFVGPDSSGPQVMARNLLRQSLCADPALDACVIDPSGSLMAPFGRLVPIAMDTPSAAGWNVCAIEWPAADTYLADTRELLLGRKLAFLELLLDLVIRPRRPTGLTASERRLVNGVLRRVYAARGITDDPCSVWNDDGASLKEMPTLRDVAAGLAVEPALRAIAAALQPYCTGGPVAFGDGPQRPSALAGRVCAFTIGALPMPHRVVAHLMLGELIHQRAAASGRRTVLVVDEAELAFAQEPVAVWYTRLLQESRRRELSVWLLARSWSSLATAHRAHEFLACMSPIWLGGTRDDGERRVLVQRFALSRDEQIVVSQNRPLMGLWLGTDFRAMTRMPDGAMPWDQPPDC